MTSVWKRLQRTGKRASRFQFVASYQELILECTQKWQPDKVVVVWTRRNRRVSSKAHSWQPGIKDPFRGSVVWAVPENVDITATLYRDPHSDHFEEKEWTFQVEGESKGHKKLLAVAPIDLQKFAAISSAPRELKLTLSPRSVKVVSATLTVSIACTLLREGKATDDDMQSIASLLSLKPSDIADLNDFNEEDEEEKSHRQNRSFKGSSSREPTRELNTLAEEEDEASISKETTLSSQDTSRLSFTVPPPVPPFPSRINIRHKSQKHLFPAAIKEGMKPSSADQHSNHSSHNGKEMVKKESTDGTAANLLHNPRSNVVLKTQEVSPDHIKPCIERTLEQLESTPRDGCREKRERLQEVGCLQDTISEIVAIPKVSVGAEKDLGKGKTKSTVSVEDETFQKVTQQPVIKSRVKKGRVTGYSYQAAEVDEALKVVSLQTNTEHMASFNKAVKLHEALPSRTENSDRMYKMPEVISVHNESDPKGLPEKACKSEYSVTALSETLNLPKAHSFLGTVKDIPDHSIEEIQKDTEWLPQNIETKLYTKAELVDDKIHAPAVRMVEKELKNMQEISPKTKQNEQKTYSMDSTATIQEMLVEERQEAPLVGEFTQYDKLSQNTAEQIPQSNSQSEVLEQKSLWIDESLLEVSCNKQVTLQDTLTNRLKEKDTDITYNKREYVPEDTERQCREEYERTDKETVERKWHKDHVSELEGKKWVAIQKEEKEYVHLPSNETSKTTNKNIEDAGNLGENAIQNDRKIHETARKNGNGVSGLKETGDITKLINRKEDSITQDAAAFPKDNVPEKDHDIKYQMLADIDRGPDIDVQKKDVIVEADRQRVFETEGSDKGKDIENNSEENGVQKSIKPESDINGTHTKMYMKTKEISVKEEDQGEENKQHYDITEGKTLNNETFQGETTVSLDEKATYPVDHDAKNKFQISSTEKNSKETYVSREQIDKAEMLYPQIYNTAEVLEKSEYTQEKTNLLIKTTAEKSVDENNMDNQEDKLEGTGLQIGQNLIKGAKTIQVEDVKNAHKTNDGCINEKSLTKVCFEVGKESHSEREALLKVELNKKHRADHNKHETQELAEEKLNSKLVIEEKVVGVVLALTTDNTVATKHEQENQKATDLTLEVNKNIEVPCGNNVVMTIEQKEKVHKTITVQDITPRAAEITDHTIDVSPIAVMLEQKPQHETDPNKESEKRVKGVVQERELAFVSDEKKGNYEEAWQLVVKEHAPLAINEIQEDTQNMENAHFSLVNKPNWGGNIEQQKTSMVDQAKKQKELVEDLNKTLQIVNPTVHTVPECRFPLSPPSVNGQQRSTEKKRLSKYTGDMGEVCDTL